MLRSDWEEGLQASDAAGRVLLFVAKRLGPALDREIPELGHSLRVVEIVRGLGEAEENPLGPTDVRAALLDLVDAGLLGREADSWEDEDLVRESAAVELRVRGLRAACRLAPTDGASERVVTLVSKKRDYPLKFRFETGRRELNGQLNRTGVALAVMLVLGARRPSQSRPMVLAELIEDCERLAVFGIGPRFGRGDRLSVRDDAVRSAVKLVAEVMPVTESRSESDSRVVTYYLDGAPPEIRVEARGVPELNTWKRVQGAVRSLLDRTEFQIPSLESKLR